MFTCYDTVHKHFDKVNTHIHIVQILFTCYNTVYKYFETVYSMFTHYDTVHAYFDSSINVHTL